MLAELRVRQLGVIDDLTLVLGPGMTALTGETGAGKTLVVEAIELLLGGRADPALVRPGAGEATVEGRFVTADGVEVVLARVVAAAGRTRSYIDGSMATAAALAEVGAGLVDLHGQHAHQSLLSPAAQRDGLDQAGGVDASAVAEARRRVREIEAAQAALGGDPRARARELDLLRFQLQELDDAQLSDPGEEGGLQDEQERLAGAGALREAAARAHAVLVDDDGALDRLGAAVAALDVRGTDPADLAGLADRLRALVDAVADAASDARQLAEDLEDDPARLADVSTRLVRLGELRRKYGDTVGDVIAYRETTRAALAHLEEHDARAATLNEARDAARTAQREAEAALRQAREEAAGPFATAVEGELRTLAMPLARFEVSVTDPAGESVAWLLAANPGQPLRPLQKVASGGELARTMLAARLALIAGRTGPGVEHPPTLIFDEVDAGVGGEAAAAVGEALTRVAAHHQVLVVTHLAQVAAGATAQIAVRKDVVGDATIATATRVEGAARVVELSRMLSGRPDSPSARRHAKELLAGARAGGPSAGERRRAR